MRSFMKNTTTIVRIEPTDIMGTLQVIERLEHELTDKEKEANRIREEVETWKKNARARLAAFPALLTEFEAELAELSRRRMERETREMRIAALRKQTQQ